MAFLDVLIMKEEDGRIQTGVYRKATNNSIYIHWNSYAPKQWKIGTLSGMIRRAYEICSNEDELKKELTHLKKVFTVTNGYPQYLVSSVMEKTKKNNSRHAQEAHPKNLKIQPQMISKTKKKRLCSRYPMPVKKESLY